MAKFKVGQLVEVVDASGPYIRLIGERCTITQVNEADPFWKYCTDIPDIFKPGMFIWGDDDNFKPVDDGDEKSSWEAMKDIWVPKTVVLQ